LKQQAADDARNAKRAESESTGRVAELNARLTVAEALVEEKKVSADLTLFIDILFCGSCPYLHLSFLPCLRFSFVRPVVSAWSARLLASLLFSCPLVSQISVRPLGPT